MTIAESIKEALLFIWDGIWVFLCMFVGVVAMAVLVNWLSIRNKRRRREKAERAAVESAYAAIAASRAERQRMMIG